MVFRVVKRMQLLMVISVVKKGEFWVVLRVVKRRQLLMVISVAKKS